MVQTGCIHPAKITLEVVFRVGHQPQMGQRIAAFEGLNCQGVKHKIGRKYIASCEPKHVAEQGQGSTDPPSGFEGLAEIKVFA